MGYVGDCESCKDGATSAGFSFIVGGGSDANADDSKCLNYFVGHLKRECSSGSKCVVMVDKAFVASSTSKFCNYPDLQCKQKIQDSIESSMTTIAIFGVIFCLFFMAIIFFTLQAIHIYKGGEGGDDGADDDDDDE